MDSNSLRLNNLRIVYVGSAHWALSKWAFASVHTLHSFLYIYCGMSKSHDLLDTQYRMRQPYPGITYTHSDMFSSVIQVLVNLGFADIYADCIKVLDKKNMSTLCCVDRFTSSIMDCMSEVYHKYFYGLNQLLIEDVALAWFLTETFSNELGGLDPASLHRLMTHYRGVMYTPLQADKLASIVGHLSGDVSCQKL